MKMNLTEVQNTIKNDPNAETVFTATIVTKMSTLDMDLVRALWGRAKVHCRNGKLQQAVFDCMTAVAHVIPFGADQNALPSGHKPVSASLIKNLASVSNSQGPVQSEVVDLLDELEKIL